MPSIQKQSLSFLLDPCLNDLNLLTNVLFLLVIFGKILSIINEINLNIKHILVKKIF